MRLSAALAVACLSTLAMAADDAQAATKKGTTISAQGLGPALQRLALDRDVQLVYRSELVGNLQTSGAVGELTLDEALIKLLKGTGLTYQFIEDTAVTIVPLSTSSARLNTRDTQGAAADENKGLWDRFRLAQAEGQVSREARTQSSAAARAEPDTRMLEEIIVTAQRREERLQDVPISITVLDGDYLDRTTDSGVAAVLNKVPGVIAIESGGNTKLNIRGVSSSANTFAGSSAIGYYLDSVPFGFVKTAFVPDTNAYDLDRIEAMRGPQGTLYGANALNGVVRVLTRDADLERVEFKTRALGSSTEEGAENYRVDGAVNIPIVDGKFAVRAVASYDDASGWIDKPNRENANDSQVTTGRIKFNLQPTEEFSASAFAWISRGDYGTLSTSADGRTNPSSVDESGETNYEVYGAKATYSFPTFALTSSTSYMDYETRDFLDSLTFLGIVLANRDMRFFAQTFTEEISLVSTHEGPWRWSVGGMYRDANDKSSQLFLTGPAAAPLTLRHTSESYAAFGELTRLFADGRFELTGGVRYFEDRVTAEEQSDFLNRPILGLYYRDKFSATTPRVVFSWHADADATIYASYSEGFRSGVPQGSAIFRSTSLDGADPDNLRNYELGIKGNWLDGRVSYDVAVYHIDWRDVQQQINTLVPTPTGSTVFFAVVNGAAAEGEGVDVSVTLAPTERFTFGLSFAWNSLEMTEDVFQQTSITTSRLLFNKGDRLNASPEYSAAASISYSMPLTSSGYEAQFLGTANYVSHQDLRQLVGPPATSVPVVAEGDEMVIGRASVSLHSPSSWSLSLFADNVGNEHGAWTRDVTNPNAHTRTRPRTIGLQFEYRY